MTTTSATAAAIDRTGVDALTADGDIVHIRPVAPADRGRLAGLYERASSDSLRLRFFITPSRAMIVAELGIVDLLYARRQRADPRTLSTSASSIHLHPGPKQPRSPEAYGRWQHVLGPAPKPSRSVQRRLRP